MRGHNGVKVGRRIDVLSVDCGLSVARDWQELSNRFAAEIELNVARRSGAPGLGKLACQLYDDLTNQVDSPAAHQ